MKKITLLAMSALALSASAQTFVVWQDSPLTDGQVQIPVNYYTWEGTYESTAEDGATRWAVKNDIWFGGGWESTEEFDFTKITSGDYDLVFDIKTDIPSSTPLSIQFNNTSKKVSVQPEFTAIRNNEWQEIRIDISEAYPTVVNSIEKGDKVYCMAVVGGGGAAGKSLWLRNIRYEAAIPAMSLTAVAGDITETSANITVTTSIPEGYSDVELLMDGVAVTPVDGVVAIDGLTAGTAYTRAFRLRGVYNGKTVTSNPVEVTFSTRRAAGVNPVWYGTWDGQADGGGDLSIAYDITCNSDNTLTVNAAIDLDKIGLVYEINFQNGTDEWKGMTDVNGVQTYTTTASFNDGAVVNFFFWIKYAGGVTRVDVSYTVGSSNEKPVTQIRPEISAEALNITAESAEIAYDVVLPDELAGAAVEVLIDGNPVAESPVALTGLEAATEYSHTLKAVATLAGETYESKEVTVTFRTLRGEATDLILNGYANMTFASSYLIGQEPVAALDHFCGIPYSINYNAAGQIVVSADFSSAMNIVGIVPQACVKGKYHNLDKVDGQNIWTAVYDGDYELDAVVEIFFYSPYAGGVCRYDVSGYVVGAVAEPVVSGDLDRVEVILSRRYAAVDVPLYASVKATDASGRFISADPQFEGEGISVNGNALTVSAKGNYTVTATVGETAGQASFLCVVSKDATNLAKDILPVVSELGENPAHATDENESTELVFNCADTQEHSVSVDLKKNFNIEAVELVWEGASATHYTVTLEKGAEQVVARAAEAPVVYTVEGGEGGAGVSPRAFLYQDDMSPVVAQTVTVNTTRAFEPAWGIKLRQIRVFGTDADTSGVDSVIVDSDAPVNVYTVTGVLVRGNVAPADATLDLPAGIYIVGNSKVIVR